MLISQIRGHVDNEGRYNVEFRAGGHVFALRNITPEVEPTISTEVKMVGDGEGTVYVASLERSYRPAYYSHMTDLIILEPIDEDQIAELRGEVGAAGI